MTNEASLTQRALVRLELPIGRRAQLVGQQQLEGVVAERDSASQPVGELETVGIDANNAAIRGLALRDHASGARGQTAAARQSSPQHVIRTNKRRARNAWQPAHALDRAAQAGRGQVGEALDAERAQPNARRGELWIWLTCLSIREHVDRMACLGELLGGADQRRNRIEVGTWVDHSEAHCLAIMPGMRC